MVDNTTGTRKSIRLKRQRDGRLRAHWYGQYQLDGKHREINLNVKWRGTPPASGKWSDLGDASFEGSREQAKRVLAAHVEEAKHKGRAEHLTERLIESKTGRIIEYARLDELSERWRSLGRETTVTERHLKACDAHFKRFADFIHTRNPASVYLYEVTTKDVAAFVENLRGEVAAKTAGDAVKLLNKSFSRFLPVGAENPFSGFVGRRTNGKGSSIHRKPFTPEELRGLLETAKEDDFMYPLIVTAACTGMRRGDVCRLKWSAVDWDEGVLAVKTKKTEAGVEIPIFPPLMAVLTERRKDSKGYVFPEAARMLKENPDGLTYRFKKIVARSLVGDELDNHNDWVPAKQIQKEALAAIKENVPVSPRRERMIQTFKMYAAGSTYCQIHEATGYPKSGISTDMHLIQDWIGQTFIKAKRKGIQQAVRDTTQIQREHGQRAASIRDWHALRATFVTLALAAGVPVELVRRITGHATLDVVLKHYFRPDREHFRSALMNAMPGVLIGGKPLKKAPVDELASLASKITSGPVIQSELDRIIELARNLKVSESNGC